MIQLHWYCANGLRADLGIGTLGGGGLWQIPCDAARIISYCIWGGDKSPGRWQTFMKGFAISHFSYTYHARYKQKYVYAIAVVKTLMFCKTCFLYIVIDTHRRIYRLESVQNTNEITHVYHNGVLFNDPPWGCPTAAFGVDWRLLEPKRGVFFSTAAA